MVPPEKRVGVDLLKLAVPEIADVVDKISTQLQRDLEDKLRENSWVVVARKRVQTVSFQQNLQNEPVGREAKFLQTFLINHVE